MSSSISLAKEVDIDAVVQLLDLGAEAQAALREDQNDAVEFLVAKGPDGGAVGCAAFGEVPNVLTGGRGILLYALAVAPSHRGQGHGKALLVGLASLCLERGITQMNWSVDRLDLDTRTFFDLTAPDSFKLNKLVYALEVEGVSELARR